MAKQVKKIKKVIKKSFFEVEIPMTSIKAQLYGGSLDEMNGKTMRIDLTKSLRGKSLELKTKIKVENGKAIAVPLSLMLAGSYIKRAMRRGISYVEDSFDVECRDFIVRVKPFLITRKNVSRVVRKVLRENARKYIESNFKIRSVMEIFSDIITNKFQKNMAIKLKKIYPLAMCEIRVFEIKKEKPKKTDNSTKEKSKKE